MATFNGTESRNVIYGTGLNDIIKGNGGNDHLLGQGGSDAIDGGLGDDKLDGGSGNDTIQGGFGIDFLAGGMGNDFLFGGDGEDYLWDLTGKDTLRGENGNDRLVGNKDSKVDGGIGDDVLVAEIAGPMSAIGSGHYTGGEGHNTLRVNAASGEKASDSFTFISVTGKDPNGLFGEVGKQDSITNSDYWVRSHSLNFDGIKSFELTDGSPLYFEGAWDLDGSPKDNYGIVGGSSFDFITLGTDNETVTTKSGGDSIYATGFSADANGVYDYGTDHITDFNEAEGDVLLLGSGYGNTHVDITETGTQTFVRSYIDGQEAPVNTIILDVVGVQDAIWLGWTPV